MKRKGFKSFVLKVYDSKGLADAFLRKCVKRKGFKSFVLKVCETKGVADAFLGKCVNLKELTEKS